MSVRRAVDWANYEPEDRSPGGPAFIVFLINLRCEAQIRCVVAAIACERYRLERGSWPKSWSELVPEYLEAEPVDPFTGKALLMKVAGGVLTVYSVGEDIADDGGVRVNAAGREFEKGADIPFVIRPRK